MALMQSLLKKLPLSPAMFYLLVGYALGPGGFHLIDLQPRDDAVSLTAAAEAALLISLFTVGLKSRIPLTEPIWRLPLRLAGPAMVITIGLMTMAGMLLLGLPLAPALLLASILAPTDPILASDVQVQEAGDRDVIRFGITAEGGMNDGTTYPFIMLGLALMAVPEAQAYGDWRGIGIALWGIAAGLASGWLLGWLTAKLVVRLRHGYRIALGMEEFLTLGLIGLAYGAAHLVHGIGFIAVFAAGVAVRQIEHAASGSVKPADVIGAVAVGAEPEVATDPDKASAYMTETVLGFNEQLEHIAELIMVVMAGVLLSSCGVSMEGVVVALVLLLVVRPIAVRLTLLRAPLDKMQRRLIAWFGIRGIGSLYYLMFAMQFDALAPYAQRFLSIVLTVITISILIHGMSSTPLMAMYYRRQEKQRNRQKA